MRCSPRARKRAAIGVFSFFLNETKKRDERENETKKTRFRFSFFFLQFWAKKRRGEPSTTPPRPLLSPSTSASSTARPRPGASASCSTPSPSPRAGTRAFLGKRRAPLRSPRARAGRPRRRRRLRRPSRGRWRGGSFLDEGRSSGGFGWLVFFCFLWVCVAYFLRILSWYTL